MRTALLFAAFFCPSILLAQGLWSVHSPNGVDVWAVGNQGSIFRSFDGGVTWSSHQQGSSTLRSVFTLGTDVWTAGDNGVVLRSSNSGNDWVSIPVGTSEHLRSVFFISPSKGWIVGSGGTILASTNGGTVWTPKSSTTTYQLNSLWFINDITGYAAGESGILLKTNDGGNSWTSVGAGWTGTLTSVAAKGQVVYVTASDGRGYVSVNGGSSWSPLNLMTDSRSDAVDVFVQSESQAFFTGGGGYIRETRDGGKTFRWATHPLNARISKMFFFDAQSGWACSEKFNVVIRTTNGGQDWHLPSGTTVTAAWTQKLSSSGSIGNTLTLSPWEKNKIYCALGNRIFMSTDLGETWVQTSTIASTSGSTHSFYISPKDTNLYVAAFTGGGDHIRRSTNRGQTWTTTISRAFSSFGMPLEMDGSNPDTLYFAPEDGQLYRSTDFGATWTSISSPGFTSPCDFVVVRDSANILWCGDSGPSRISRSTDAGLTWTLVYNGGGAEIPTIANGNMINGIGFATAWSSGGVQRTSNYGATWDRVTTTNSAWGVDIAKDDPTVAMFGVYGGGATYLSNNSGGSFTSSTITGANYAILAYNRSTFIAQQSGGIFKYSISYSVPVSNQQVVGVVFPNGGETFQYGTTRNISWTSNNFSSVKLEFKTSPASPWQLIADNVPASSGSYGWLVPNAPTSQARVRVSDAVDGVPSDTSDGFFSITVAAFASSPSSLEFGQVGTGRSKVDTLRITNSGTAPLVISSALTSIPQFQAGRSSFSIPPGATDTLTVSFRPSSVRSYVDTLRIATNSPSGFVRIPLSGNGVLVPTVAVISPNGGEVWGTGTTQQVRWTSSLIDQVSIHYRVLPTVNWRVIAAGVAGSAGVYAWQVPNTPANQVIVRVVSSVDGEVVDESDAPFSIQASTSVGEPHGIPAAFELAQNFPNPFNPSTLIRYGLPRESKVKITIFTTLGEEVAILVNEQMPAGWHTATYTAANAVASGIYYYRLTAGDVVITRKLVLLR